MTDPRPWTPAGSPAGSPVTSFRPQAPSLRSARACGDGFLRGLGRSLVLPAAVLLLAAAPASASAQSPPPPGFHASDASGEPVQVGVAVEVIKLYNIDTVDETYVIDGYLTLYWQDDRLAVDGPAGAAAADEQGAGPGGAGDGGRAGGAGFLERSWENDVADAVLGSEIWWPNVELINVIGSREVPNRRLVVGPGGEARYEERFLATFHTPMDFRRYPFDSQSFKVEIESFSYGAEQLLFVDSMPRPVLDTLPSDAWYLAAPVGTDTVVTLAAGDRYARFDVVVQADRLPGYFIWQVFLPLFVIIAASWTVFWIEDFGHQLGTAFTLMLTVVAFNFYMTSELPELPYNTLIETVIILGYLAMLVTIVLVVAGHVIELKGREELTRRWMVRFRWLIPLGYVVSLLFIGNAFMG